MAGKGSAPRPFSVSKEQFSNNWDAIFNKPKEQEFVFEDDETGVQLTLDLGEDDAE